MSHHLQSFTLVLSFAPCSRRVASGVARFSFLPPPNFFLGPPRNFFGRKKLLLLDGKNVKICDFGQKKPSDFGEDLFFGDHLLLVGKFAISVRKSLRISAKTFFSFFFFWRSFAFGRKLCNFSQKKPSDFGEDFFFFFEITCDFGQKTSAKTFAPYF